ncbi:MAG: hypothetical protein JWP63_3691 [Candidatus Solibacter sp.]|jgi:hypothetical protein|nr:hypothetical protein [Candidatus Solibacter sp.]
MDIPAREIKISRRSWLLAGLATSLLRALAAETLKVQYDGDNLHVAVPTLHFLTGKPLERLKDGDVVAYVAQIELFNDDRSLVVKQQKGRFVVSWDLWEATYSVTQLGSSPRTAERLSAVAAEEWCLNQMAIPTLNLAPDRFYWLRFNLRTGSPRDFAAEDQPGISFRGLIDALSKKNSPEIHWGPFEARVRLTDMPRMGGRGSRNG